MTQRSTPNYDALIDSATKASVHAVVAASEAVLAYWPSPTNSLYDKKKFRHSDKRRSW